MTHTEGPWSRNIKPASRYPVVFAGRNTHVAVVTTRGLTEEEIEGNINLIANAPTTLLAAETMLVILKAIAGNPTIMGGHVRTQDADLIRAAITQAEAAGIKAL